jgi:hypothetical protein
LFSLGRNYIDIYTEYLDPKENNRWERERSPHCEKSSGPWAGLLLLGCPYPCVPPLPSAQQPSWHVMETHKGKNSTGSALTLFIICHIVPPLCCTYEICKTPDGSETIAAAEHNGGESQLNCGCNLECFAFVTAYGMLQVVRRAFVSAIKARERQGEEKPSAHTCGSCSAEYCHPPPPHPGSAGLGSKQYRQNWVSASC